MAYKVIILYQLYMPSYFLGTFTEYPYFNFFIMENFIIFVLDKIYVKLRVLKYWKLLS